MIRRVLEEASIRGSLVRVVFPAGASFLYIIRYVSRYISLRVWPETEAVVEVKKRQSDGEWRHFAVMDLALAAEPAGCRVSTSCAGNEKTDQRADIGCTPGEFAELLKRKLIAVLRRWARPIAARILPQLNTLRLPRTSRRLLRDLTRHRRTTARSRTAASRPAYRGRSSALRSPRRR